MQLTRMPQGSMSAGFPFTKLTYIVLGEIPEDENTFPGMKSLLVSEDSQSLPRVSFYIDDMISGFVNLEDAYNFLANELIPWLELARLKLSFKKMELFMDKIIALGTLHKSGGFVCMTPEQRNKIIM